MHSLTPEQRARVLAMHMPCKATIDGSADPFMGGWLDYKCISAAMSYDSLQILLRPLSSITDEDAIEVACLCYALNRCQLPEGLYLEYKVNEWNKDGFALLKLLGSGPEYSDTDAVIMSFGSSREYVRARQGVEYFSSMSESFQYLIQKGYAVPLFIAPGHPDNGKTAIELGLAIDATTIKAA